MDVFAHTLSQYVGDFEWYDSIDTRQRVIRLADGQEFVINAEVMYEKSPIEFMKYLIDLMGKKQADAAKTYVLEADNRPEAKRIKEINAELDILRGIVPTPAGYTIDIKRAKELMTELKQLTKP